MQKIKSNYLPKAIFIFAMFDILDMKLVQHYLKVKELIFLNGHTPYIAKFIIWILKKKLTRIL